MAAHLRLSSDFVFRVILPKTNLRVFQGSLNQLRPPRHGFPKLRTELPVLTAEMPMQKRRREARLTTFPRPEIAFYDFCREIMAVQIPLKAWVGNLEKRDEGYVGTHVRKVVRIHLGFG